MKEKDKNSNDESDSGTTRKRIMGKSVLIGMSGGACSSAAAFLLKKQGYKCHGVAILMIDPILKRALPNISTCSSVEELESVKAICKHIEIPFYGVMASKEFIAEIIDQIVAARLAGEKFWSCLEATNLVIRTLVEKADFLGAEHISTGHLVKIHNETITEGKKIPIFSSNDPDNDQSHLISQVPDVYLERLILPLSDLRKTDAEKILDNYQVPYHKDRLHHCKCFSDSREVISLTELQSPENLRENGDVVDIRNDNILGGHKGIHNYEVGQSKITINTSMNEDEKINLESFYYVIKLNAVEKKVMVGPQSMLVNKACSIRNIVIHENLDFTRPMSGMIKFGNSKTYLPGKIFFLNNNCATISLDNAVVGPGKGGLVVVYDRDGMGARLLFSGIIENMLSNEKPLSRVEIVEEKDAIQEKADNEREADFAF